MKKLVMILAMFAILFNIFCFGTTLVDPFEGLVQFFSEDSFIKIQKGRAPGWFLYRVENFNNPREGEPKITNIFLEIKGASLEQCDFENWRFPSENTHFIVMIDYKDACPELYSMCGSPDEEDFVGDDLKRFLQKIKELYLKKVKPIKISPEAKKFYDVIIRTDKEETEVPEEIKRITPKKEKELMKEAKK